MEIILGGKTWFWTFRHFACLSLHCVVHFEIDPGHPGLAYSYVFGMLPSSSLTLNQLLKQESEHDFTLIVSPSLDPLNCVVLRFKMSF